VSRSQDLERIEAALARAREILERFPAGRVEHTDKGRRGPVTEADTAIDAALRDTLPDAGEGWLSEETADGEARLGCRRVWIVDPLDGTKEFVAGVPEWGVSVALVEDGVAVAGGVCIPPRGLTIVGADGAGVRVNGQPAACRTRTALDGAEILASRSEVARGEWSRFDAAPFSVRPMGSIACKLALVAAGLADATWTLVPKHEWDVAGGVALVLAGGGRAWLPDGSAPRFNRPRPRLPGLVAAPGPLEPAIRSFLGHAPVA
jgi:myo-inositol-1(or 4)-monophosphatase